jgi:glycosyltransferase involved in cell wall biosynthesis
MNNRFVILTAAKNEEEYLPAAIESVIRQSIVPIAWVIMDDGSTDRTAEVVSEYAKKYPFIRLHTNRTGGKRSFGAQYRAINAAYALVKDLEFDFVCIQDADIAPVDSEYFATLLQEFRTDESLGICGGYIYERSGSGWACRKANSPASVAGGVQMHRRQFYDQTGGYKPLAYGGEDWLIQIEAKVAGWGVRAATDLPVYHYRTTSSAGGRLRGLFRLGMRDASFGSNFFFEAMKCARRISERPRVLSSLIRFAGYMWYGLSRRAPVVGPETVRYLHDEQIQRVRRFIPQLFRLRRASQ